MSSRNLNEIYFGGRLATISSKLSEFYDAFYEKVDEPLYGVNSKLGSKLYLRQDYPEIEGTLDVRFDYEIEEPSQIQKFMGQVCYRVTPAPHRFKTTLGWTFEINHQEVLTAKDGDLENFVDDVIRWLFDYYNEHSEDEGIQDHSFGA